MHYFFEDLTGLAAATLLSLMLLLLPGFGLVEAARRRGWVDGDGLTQASWAFVLGPALLPALDALLLRGIGFVALLTSHAALAIVGAKPAFAAARRVSARWWIGVAAAWLIVAWANVDFDWNQRLSQSLTIVDTVKHAAVIAELARQGLPLHDPFFARSGIAGYYYYFYIGPALVDWLGGQLIDARAAFAAASFVTLLAFPAMLFRLAEAARLIPEGARPRFLRLLVFLCCISGFDLLPGLAIAGMTGITLPQLDWWSEEVRWVLTSILWVPHHMTAIVAVFTGCLLLAEGGPSPRVARAVIAGFAFATAFGCSVWVALAAAAVLVLWWLYEWRESGLRSAGLLPLSGVAALLLVLPQLHDIVSGRSMSGWPLGLWIRGVGLGAAQPHSIAEALAHLALIPGAYIVEFGIFGLGATAYLARGGFGQTRSTPIGRLLLVGACAGLLLATFVRSVIIYNDFGWRAMWFVEVPALLWTASLLSRVQNERQRSIVWPIAAALGLAATLWDVAGMRLIRPPAFRSMLSYVNSHPEADYDARGAYRWIDAHLPRDMLVQHNPALPVRAFDFGLYGERPVPVADAQARLFGASEQEVDDRLRLVAPIFERDIRVTEVRQRAKAAGAGAIILTSADPAWMAAGGPPPGWLCNYRSARSCVMVLEQAK